MGKKPTPRVLLCHKGARKRGGGSGRPFRKLDFLTASRCATRSEILRPYPSRHDKNKKSLLGLLCRKQAQIWGLLWRAIHFWRSPKVGWVAFVPNSFGACTHTHAVMHTRGSLHSVAGVEACQASARGAKTCPRQPLFLPSIPSLTLNAPPGSKTDVICSRCSSPTAGPGARKEKRFRV